jgi:hypothetical protein
LISSVKIATFLHISKIAGACIGPKRGPVQAKTAENACMGPKDGPVCTFLILVDSDWSLSLKEVDSGLTLLLV